MTLPYPFEPDQNPTTAPFPNPSGDATYSPKVLGQVARVRQELSRYSTENIGLQIIYDGELTDPDNGSVTAEIFLRTTFDDFDSDNLGVRYDMTSLVEREDVGVYSFRLGTSYTRELGLLAAHWIYTVDGEPHEFWEHFQILEPMPMFDLLSDGERDVIRMVQMMFEDLYDSTEGGPHLKEQFQTHFGTETLVMCMKMAMMRINVGSQPLTYWVVGDNNASGTRMPAKFLPVLMLATYVEVIRHLIRSYVEQPSASGSLEVGYLDRRDYMDRWAKVLETEQEGLDNAIRMLKRTQMGLGGGRLIVAGGVWGSAYWFRPGMYAAGVRANRFYPASMIISGPGS